MRMSHRSVTSGSGFESLAIGYDLPGSKRTARPFRGLVLQMSEPDEQVEPGQRWLRKDGSGRELVINCLIDTPQGTDWSVTALPSVLQMMKTTVAITTDYQLVRPGVQILSPSDLP
jgi:hypothetical protein